MKIYIGNAGSKKHHELMRQHDWGMMHTPDWRNPINGIKFWALDNGAYSAWVNGREFDGEKFLAVINKIPAENPPDFIVLPDIVAAGKDSLLFSYQWKAMLPPEYRYYLAVQDGVVPDDLDWLGYDGIFVGGTLKWKMRTGVEWVQSAHENEMPCHIGKVGTFRRLFWAYRIGVDSIDSSTFPCANGGRDGFKRIVYAKDAATKIGRLV